MDKTTHSHFGTIQPMNNMENIDISYKALSNDEGSASTDIPKKGEAYGAGGWASSRNPAVAFSAS